jgi:4-hydroxy-tetrahydrodipicolinate reductase
MAFELYGHETFFFVDSFGPANYLCLVKIAIIGYGKMGKMLEALAPEYQIEVVERYDSANPLLDSSPLHVDVAIDFTEPNLALKHIDICTSKRVALVVGTTGWYSHFDQVEQWANERQSALFYATNFSVGVNLFFQLNAQLAAWIKGQGYQALLTEIHHTGKKDAPSGTALTLAQGIIDAGQYEDWILKEPNVALPDSHLPIDAQRLDPVPGTHSIEWNSPIDSLTIQHTAHSREGFARGALVATQWVFGKTGVFTMRDMLNFTDSNS